MPGPPFPAAAKAGVVKERSTADRCFCASPDNDKPLETWNNPARLQLLEFAERLERQAKELELQNQPAEKVA
jgi:hypothetical protein